MDKKHHRTAKLHIKKGDTVSILTGNYKHKRGKVLKVFTGVYKATVEGINIVSRHRKPSAKNPQGGIEKKEAPIHISNLMLVDPVTGNTTRVGRKRNPEEKLKRYAKKTGNLIKDE